MSVSRLFGVLLAGSLVPLAGASLALAQEADPVAVGRGMVEMYCADCHATNGRLQKVTGIYIPGRASDHTAWLDRSGWSLAAFALLGVLVHGTGRVVSSRRNGSSHRKS